MTPSAAKVAASTTPAEVITPPVTPRPRRMPARVPCFEGLLADPGHQEDVVVHAQGHEEDEAEQRHGGVRAREPEDVVEHEGGDAHRGAVGEDHRGDQQDRRQHGAQQQHQDQRG